MKIFGKICKCGNIQEEETLLKVMGQEGVNRSIEPNSSIVAESRISSIKYKILNIPFKVKF